MSQCYSGTTHVIVKKEHINLINSLEDAFRYSNYLSVCMQDRVVSHCKNDFRLE